MVVLAAKAAAGRELDDEPLSAVATSRGGVTFSTNVNEGCFAAVMVPVAGLVVAKTGSAFVGFARCDFFHVLEFAAFVRDLCEEGRLTSWCVDLEFLHRIVERLEELIGPLFG